MDRRGNNLSSVMREAWDSGNLETMTKNSPLKASGAHVSIIGHITREELKRELTATEAANGFANRFLLVHTQRSKRLPFGGDSDAGRIELLQGRFARVINDQRGARRFEFHSSARPLWVEFYNSVPDDVPGLFGAVTSRAEPQVLRLALVYAILDEADAIYVDHLRAALAVWRYCEDSARWVFEDTVGDPLADTLLAFLRTKPDGVTRTDISKHVGKNRTKAHLDEALEKLANRGLARRHHVSSSSGGRPAENWVASSFAGTKETKEPLLGGS